MRSLLVAIVLLASPVTARAGADDAAIARDLFRAGLDAMTAQDFDTACGRFAEAHKRDPNVGYVVNLARCEDKRGHLTRARQQWQEALDLARARHDERLAEVERGLSAIDARVPRIRIESAGSIEDGLVLRVDGKDVGAAAIGIDLAVDPGDHVVVAEAPRHSPWTAAVHVDGGHLRATVLVPPLVSSVDASGVAAPAAPVAPVAPPRSREGAPTPEPVRRGAVQRIVGIAALATGIVAIGVGGYFAWHAKSLDGDSRAYCDPGNPDACQGKGIALRDDARTSGNVATAFMVSGAVASAAGLVVLLTAPRSKSNTAALRATALGTAGAGASLTGTW